MRKKHEKIMNMQNYNRKKFYILFEPSPYLENENILFELKHFVKVNHLIIILFCFESIVLKRIIANLDFVPFTKHDFLINYQYSCSNID